MEGTIILGILLIFFIGMFLVKETPESDKKLEDLISEVERKEALLKRIDHFYELRGIFSVFTQEQIKNSPDLKKKAKEVLFEAMKQLELL